MVTSMEVRLASVGPSEQQQMFTGCCKDRIGENFGALSDISAAISRSME